MVEAITETKTMRCARVVLKLAVDAKATLAEVVNCAFSAWGYRPCCCCDGCWYTLLCCADTRLCTSTPRITLASKAIEVARMLVVVLQKAFRRCALEAALIQVAMAAAALLYAELVV
eukprot:TRINITY_DN4454_c0_g1_i1.p1 TRINITY_DN4454_c0_g1~~TRINITY_DN4454_c0_g1_i1.p1  ORF type:complete len:117 (-),score=11.68 TRINITY_DN4454_c0_g1_i1:93-443(-)